MKRMILLLLCLALLAACSSTPAQQESTQPTTTQPTTTQPTTTQPTETTTAQTEPTEPQDVFVFTRENFPRMDGSTAMIPLGEAIASVLLGEPREAVGDLVQFNRTTQSFRNLMWEECDILIVSQPNAAVFEEMEYQGFEVDMTPIATDALIFVVNENNPVDNLTTEQVRKIYSGEITNWSEVGGNDEPIMAFQRNEDAGSQALMRKLVMGETPMMEAPSDTVIGSMGELMSSVKSYDNAANAIGYSVYYYANDMKMAQGLKILSIDGVEPNAESIRSGAYPHLNAYYCVIPAKAAEDAPNRILYQWLQTQEGQNLLTTEGYVSVLEEKP